MSFLPALRGVASLLSSRLTRAWRRIVGLSLAAGLFSAGALAAPPLLSPTELHALLKQAPADSVRVIDIRESRTYHPQHIPGAVSAPYVKWRGPASNPGELPELPKLSALVQQLGLTPTVHAVVVSGGADATDFGAAARVYWTLKVLGLKELSLLNGGMKAWAQAGLPQDGKEPIVDASTYQPTLDKSLIATKEEVQAQLEAGKGRFVDARTTDFFLGQTRHAAAALPGTLKGAVHLSHESWFVPGTGTFVPAAEAQRIAGRLGASGTSGAGTAADTVSFCNTGHWAATNWFALSEVAGQKQVKLYAGSMVEWTKDGAESLMANVPGRLQQLAINAKLWADRTLK